jgi:hypothetical protein
VFALVTDIIGAIIIMTMAACTNSAGLIASRVFLGIPESGVVTCGVMYFSFWVCLSMQAIFVLTLAAVQAQGESCADRSILQFQLHRPGHLRIPRGWDRQCKNRLPVTGSLLIGTAKW